MLFEFTALFLKVPLHAAFGGFLQTFVIPEYCIWDLFPPNLVLAPNYSHSLNVWEDSHSSRSSISKVRSQCATGFFSSKSAEVRDGNYSPCGPLACISNDLSVRVKEQFPQRHFKFLIQFFSGDQLFYCYSLITTNTYIYCIFFPGVKTLKFCIGK